MKIYFDAYCLNRPFDDQTQDRIHLEVNEIGYGDYTKDRHELLGNPSLE